MGAMPEKESSRQIRVFRQHRPASSTEIARGLTGPSEFGKGEKSLFYAMSLQSLEASMIDSTTNGIAQSKMLISVNVTTGSRVRGAFRPSSEMFDVGGRTSREALPVGLWHPQ